MEKEKLTTKTVNKRVPLPPAARLLQAGLAFGLAYIIASWAIDSGSLLQYAVAALLLGLGARHILQAVQASRSKK
jgi:hypothetical protein